MLSSLADICYVTIGAFFMSIMNTFRKNMDIILSIDRRNKKIEHQK